jgi:hypothetical protein
MSLVFRFGRVESSSGKHDTDLLTAGLAINLPISGGSAKQQPLASRAKHYLATQQLPHRHAR